MPAHPITDEQLVDLVESLRHERHGLTAKQLKAFIVMRYGVTVTAGAAMRQAKALAEAGRLFVGLEDPIGVGPPVVYPADYRGRYEDRLTRTVTEPAERPIPLPPTAVTRTVLSGVQR